MAPSLVQMGVAPLVAHLSCYYWSGVSAITPPVALAAYVGAGIANASVKGIESQTLKLFEVCRLRDIPIITFVNMVDREGRDPFELLDEIESALALDTSPVTWPVGMRVDFHGCVDLRRHRLLTAAAGRGAAYERAIQQAGAYDPELDRRVPAHVLAPFGENAALAAAVYPELDAEAYRAGHMTPVLFGSALKDYVVDDLLRLLARVAPPSRRQPAEPRAVEPAEEKVSGFVFKVQANMDPNHRDQVAFLRLCSGRFRLRRARLDDPLRAKQLRRAHEDLAEDRDAVPVFLARNSWEMNRVTEDWPRLRFQATRERA